MTDSIDAVSDQPAADELQCPGHRLTQAREALGLSTRDIATDLRLPPKLVEALEAGDLEQLPPMAFVNGYLRSYAKLLDINAQPLVEHYNLCASDGPALVATDKTATEAKSSDLSVRMVTYLVVVGMLVLVVMWWFTNHEDRERPLPMAPVTEIQGSGEVVVAPAITSPEKTERAAAATLSASDQGASMVVDEPELSLTSLDTAPEAIASTPPAERNETTAVEVAPVVLIAPLTDATPQSSLRIELEQDSWLEIKDAVGRRLAYGLGEAGEVRLLQGEAPFSVFLGFAPGVTVYYNASLFDHSSFQRRDLARFRLGRAQDNSPIE